MRFITLSKTRASALVQPILTAILIGLLIFAAMRFGSGKNSEDKTQVQIQTQATFDQAANKFLNGNYQIATSGELFIRNSQSEITGVSVTTVNGDPVKQVNTLAYNDTYFFTTNGILKRIDFEQIGSNTSAIFMENNDIAYLANVTDTYTLIPEPDPSETNAAAAFVAAQRTLYEMLPLIPLIQDYQKGNFVPTMISPNIYSGKWQHPQYTSSDFTDILISVDPISGHFATIRFAHNFYNKASEINFIFKPMDNFEEITRIPEGYIDETQPPTYKVKEK